MTQEKVMIGGKELRVECVVKDNDGCYFKILCFSKNRFSQTKYHITPEEAEKDNEPMFTRDYCSDLEIISYPILGQDKNGDDVRLFDWIKDSYDGIHKVIGSIKSIDGSEVNSFIFENNDCPGGWDYHSQEYCTLVKPPNTLIGKTATVTIDGKSYRVEVKEEVR